jgi:hypothetical protein
VALQLVTWQVCEVRLQAAVPLEMGLHCASMQQPLDGMQASGAVHSCGSPPGHWHWLLASQVAPVVELLQSGLPLQQPALPLETLTQLPAGHDHAWQLPSVPVQQVVLVPLPHLTPVAQVHVPSLQVAVPPQSASWQHSLPVAQLLPAVTVLQ